MSRDHRPDPHVEQAQEALELGVVGLRLYVEWENERAQETYRALGMAQCHYHRYERAFIELAQG